ELSRLQAADLAAAAASTSELRLCIDLPAFPHAVLYQQLPSLAAVAAAAAAAGAKKEGGAAGGGGGGGGGPGGAATGGGGGAAGGGGGDGEGGGSLDALVLVADSELPPVQQ
ncbi:hypothetical protein Rsub_11704, partial [Raphidocelis subcapitata]